MSRPSARKIAKERARDRARAYRAAEIAKRGGKCTDCPTMFAGSAKPPEFDHLPGLRKIRNVSAMVQAGRSNKALALEMAKCDLVCHDCHGKRTQKRQIAANEKFGRSSRKKRRR